MTTAKAIKQPLDEAIASAVRESTTALTHLPGIGQPRFYTQRLEFELRLLTARKGTDFKLWDLGGGIGMLSYAAARLGIHATNVDDYADLIEKGSSYDEMAALLTGVGARPICHDLREPIKIDRGVDVITTMHTIEHMHTSPKEQYHLVAEALKPGGLFVIAAPNPVNLRKRISALSGRATWSSMDDWYEAPFLRGHVREPCVADLRYVANDLGLDATIVGKNFVGQGRDDWRRPVAKVLSPLLELRPALCSDLYLIATKP